MAYPNYGSTTAGFPAPTSGVNVPAVVVLSGTGVAQVVTRNADGAGATGGAYGSITAEQMRGPEYVAPLAIGSTLVLTAALKDAQGNTVTPVNNFTFRSLNAVHLSQKSFRPLLPGNEWLPNRTAPTVPAGQTGPGAGNSLVWTSDPATVSPASHASATTITATNSDENGGSGSGGFAIIEVRYPLSSGSTTNDFIYALLLVTLTPAGTDVE